MGKNKEKREAIKEIKQQPNESPKKDKDGNSLVPGVYGDSDPIGGG